MSASAEREMIDVLKEELGKFHARHDNEYNQLRTGLDTVIVILLGGFFWMASIFVITLIRLFNILGDIGSQVDNVAHAQPQKTISVEDIIRDHQESSQKESNRFFR